MFGSGGILTRTGGRYRYVACLFAWMLAGSSGHAADVTSTWLGGTGNWSDPTKWNSNPLFPDNGNGGFTYDAVVNGGMVTVDQDVEIQNLSFGSGSIGGDFDLTLNGVSGWTGGYMTGTGQTIIPASGSLTLQAVNLHRLLTNNGTTTWAEGDVRFSNGTFQNNATFSAVTNGVLYWGGTETASDFHNAGTFTKQGTGTVRFGSAQYNQLVRFNNSGVVGTPPGSLLPLVHTLARLCQIRNSRGTHTCG